MVLVNRTARQTENPCYSLCLITAISLQRVVSFQLLEGSVDQVIFEQFLFYTVKALRARRDCQGKTIVIQLDNARVHKTPSVLATAKRLGVVVLFSCPYSPFYAGVEQVFNYLKT